MQENWISAQELARRLEISPKAVARVAASCGIRARRIPGVAIRYNASDVARVAAEALGGPGKAVSA